MSLSSDIRFQKTRAGRAYGHFPLFKFFGNMPINTPETAQPCRPDETKSEVSPKDRGAADHTRSMENESGEGS